MPWKKEMRNSFWKQNYRGWSSFFPGLDPGWSDKPGFGPQLLERRKICLQLPSGRATWVAKFWWLSKIRGLCPTRFSDHRSQSSKRLCYLLAGRQNQCWFTKDAVSWRICHHIHTSNFDESLINKINKTASLPGRSFFIIAKFLNK